MIRKITWPKIVDMLHSAQKEVYLIMPSIHEEWVETLKANPNINDLQIHACIDNSEQAIRNGYGSILAIENLKKLTSHIMQSDGLKISFISVDEENYLLFMESRIIAGDPDGNNAIKVESSFAKNIIADFFSVSITEINNDNKPVATLLDEKQFEDVTNAIAINPPESPDLKRQISVYNTLFQFVELTFEGINIKSKTIRIPPEALPFRDADLRNRMKTNLKLFDQDKVESWTIMNLLKDRMNQIREKYLVSCKLRKEKSILKKENKREFQEALLVFEQTVNLSMVRLADAIQTELNSAEKILAAELKDFFLENLPDSVKILSDENRAIQLEKEINKVINKVKLPSANSLLDKMKIEVNYFELTWEDLDDDKLLTWFKKVELIGEKESTQIANFSNAYKIKK